ncbi:MAG: hypothetical protein ABS873_07995, partial [Alkalibacterium sp.]
MKNRGLLIPLLAVSLGLAACQGNETESGADLPLEESVEEEETSQGNTSSDGDSEDTEDTDSSSDTAITETDAEEEGSSEGEAIDPDHALLEQAKGEYTSGELDAAAGTLSRLLQQNLSDKKLLLAEAEDLKEQISREQAEAARETEDAQAETAYPAERQSALVNEEFETQTGQPLNESTDEELEAWLAEQEAQKSEPVQTDQTAEEEQADSADMTKEEAERYALDQVLKRADIEQDNYFYFVNHSKESWVQVEAREAVEQ